MIANILELINLIVLFKVVLGCGFRRNRSLLFIGGLLAAGYIVIEEIPVCGDFIMTWGYLVEGPYLMLIMSCLFNGKIWTTAGISIVEYFFISNVANFFVNIEILLVKGYLIKVNFGAWHYVALIFITAAFLVFGKFLKGKKEAIRHYLYNMSHLNWVVLVVGIDYLRNTWAWSSQGIPENEVQMMISKNALKDEIFTFAFILIIALWHYSKYHRQILQRTIRLNEKCIAEQAEQYAFMGEKEQELRKFRHDYNRHFYAIQNYLKRKEYEALEAYLAELGAVGEELSFLSTNNLICDAVINRYYSLCKEKQIDLLVTGKVAKNLLISQTDFCVILSNALENAMEATEQCTEKREITLKFRNEANLLFIDLKNPASHPLTFSEEGVPLTDKEDKKNHGIGTGNMKSAAEKNYGEVCWEYDSSGFVLTKIVLPCGELQSESI